MVKFRSDRKYEMRNGRIGRKGKNRKTTNEKQVHVDWEPLTHFFCSSLYGWCWNVKVVQVLAQGRQVPKH